MSSLCVSRIYPLQYTIKLAYFRQLSRLRRWRIVQARYRRRGSMKRPLNDDDISVKTLSQLQFIHPNSIAGHIPAQSWAIENCSRINAFYQSLAQALRPLALYDNQS
jgi:hypothetical protein